MLAQSTLWQVEGALGAGILPAPVRFIHTRVGSIYPF